MNIFFITLPPEIQFLAKVSKRGRLEGEINKKSQFKSPVV